MFVPLPKFSFKLFFCAFKKNTAFVFVTSYVTALDSPYLSIISLIFSWLAPTLWTNILSTKNPRSSINNDDILFGDTIVTVLKTL